MRKMKGDRIVLIGYIFMILIIIGLGVIAFFEKNSSAFILWILFLLFLLLIPIVFLKFLSRIQIKKGMKTKLRKIAKKLGLRKQLKSFLKVDEKLRAQKNKKKKLKQKEKQDKIKGKNIKPENTIVPESNKIIKIFEKKPEKEKKEKPKIKNKLLEVIELNKIKNVAETKASTVKTDFDAIIDYVKLQKEVKIADLAKHFKISHEKMEEWLKILADHGLVEVTYPTFGDARVKIKPEESNA